MVRQAEAYERMIPDWNKDMFTRLGMEMNEYFNLMKRIAIAYNNASDTGVRDELKQKFLAMYDHITDQGVAYGSCWGKYPPLRLQHARAFRFLLPDEGCPA